MEKVHLNLKKQIDNSYDILIDNGILNRIPLDLKKNELGNKYVIITDSNTKKLFGETFLRLMKKKGINSYLLSIESGEKNKNLLVFKKLMRKIVSFGLDRKSAIISLGGGVVGDISGFIAATYMRGINYVHIPTSLLAMVDSSIGGKVAIDLPEGKNLVGAFYQPKRVYIDICLLGPLPIKEMRNGLTEIIKHALIKDKKLFDFIEKNLDRILNKDKNILIRLIKRSCEIKADIVMKDEKEKGFRKVLNYGHTIGHALETLTHYKKYSHGEAVAIGMLVEGLISNKIGSLSKKELHRQNNLLFRAGLVKKLPNIDIREFIEQLKKDKKNVGREIEFVLLEKIGKAKFGIKVPKKIIWGALKESR